MLVGNSSNLKISPVYHAFIIHVHCLETALWDMINLTYSYLAKMLLLYNPRRYFKKNKWGWGWGSCTSISLRPWDSVLSSVKLFIFSIHNKKLIKLDICRVKLYLQSDDSNKRYKNNSECYKALRCLISRIQIAQV